MEYIVNVFILTWCSFHHISNLIGGSIKLSNERLNNTSSVVIVDVEFGGSSAPF